MSIKEDGDLLCLTKEQHIVLRYCLKGWNLFLTGSGGTGKSFLLRKIIRELRVKYAGNDQVGVTAATSIAAMNIGGSTIHSFAGLGLGKLEGQALVQAVRSNFFARQRICKCKVLIIDEISQLSGELFEKLEFVFRTVRPCKGANYKKRFGGIQLVVCGDFLQLPPVGLGISVHYCFDTPSGLWTEVFMGAKGKTFVLDRCFRTQEDEFHNALLDLRKPHPSDETVSFFKGTECRWNSIEGVQLCSTREVVDRLNNAKLKKLLASNADAYTYEADDWGGAAYADCLRSQTAFSGVLTLAVGAPVVLIANIDPKQGERRLVKGLQGRVVGFRKLESNGEMLPCVEFSFPDGSVGESIVGRQEFFVYVGEEVKASRSQVPLLLGWALTIHRAQGMEFDALKVDLDRVFSIGQAYVALSRCRKLSGLAVRGMRRDVIRTSAQALKFYRELKTMDFEAKRSKVSVQASVHSASPKRDTEPLSGMRKRESGSNSDLCSPPKRKRPNPVFSSREGSNASGNPNIPDDFFIPETP